MQYATTAVGIEIGIEASRDRAALPDCRAGHGWR
jgi:hypothetical protein